MCRSHQERLYAIQTPESTPRAPYPWEAEGNLPRITKEFFRCKGNPANPPVLAEGVSTPLIDCEGTSRHGFPIIHGKEGIYPILIDLLNYVQKKTMKRVIITCGHRCPTHNAYSDPAKEARTSKHQIGAEVDFYVQGMEERPLEIVGLLMQYYLENPAYANDKDWNQFKRYDKTESHVTIQPWLNKEIFIKLYQKNEGRDADNRHPHAYLSIQVRFDRELKERVVYDWQKATRGYILP